MLDDGHSRNACNNIRMDEKVSCVDRAFVDRLWHTCNCEEVYRNAYDNPRRTLASIKRYSVSPAPNVVSLSD